MATIPIKWYSSLMYGLPADSATYYSDVGGCVTLLDAILVDGFGLVTLDSVVVASGVATATRSAGVTVLDKQVIEIAGATPSSLNGQWRVTGINTGAKTFTFACAGVADGAATGTITVKTPGLGWERVFTATNKRVYRSQNEDSPRSYFRLDDSTSNFGAVLTCYESMTDIDTGYNGWHQTSFYAGASGIPRIAKSTGYTFVGDDRTLHGMGTFRAATVYPSMYFGFGDYVSLKPNDTKNDLVCPTQISNQSVTVLGKNAWTCGSDDASYDNHYAWMHDDAAGNRAAVFRAVRQINDASGYGGPTFPQPADNGLFITDNIIREKTASYPIRGKMRGGYWVLANQPFPASYLPNFIDGVIGLEGRQCMVVSHSMYITNNWYTGRIVFDLTGPWD
jgi:hypothetical protein